MSAPERRRTGALVLPDGSVHWRLWAPKADAVELVLLDVGRRRGIAMRREDDGYFGHTEANVPDGLRYAYRLNNGSERGDPASLWQPDGIFGPSAIVRPERFHWSDDAWKGIPRSDLVFYELHVGTFTPEGTFEAIIPRLPQLRELGVTAIELMPIAQFPNARGWGYDGVFPYAAQNTYGGPHALQHLVDACHAQGLAIVLDVVYNHVGPEGNFLGEYGPYFTDRYRTFWGPAFNYDGPGSDPVRQYVLDNARMWLEAFHFDGLRLDAVGAIFDTSAHHLLRALQEVAEDVERRTGRPRHLVAESDLNDPRLLHSPEKGGYGLATQWCDDFHHAVHAFLTGERQGYYEDFGSAEQLARVFETPFLYAGDFSKHRGRTHGAPPGDLTGDRFVVAIQNHDQVGNRARGDRLSALLPPEACRLAASLLLFAPHLPLIFMGEEYGERNPFQFFCSFQNGNLANAVREGRRREFAAFRWQGEVPDPNAESTFRASRLSWSWPEESTHAGLRQLYADLLACRRDLPALRDFVHRRARLHPDHVLELVRGGSTGTGTVQVFFNLTKEPRSLLTAPIGKRFFSSEDPRYGGGGSGEMELRPFEAAAFAATAR